MFLWMVEDSKKYQYGAFTKQEGMFMSDRQDKADGFLDFPKIGSVAQYEPSLVGDSATRISSSSYLPQGSQVSYPPQHFESSSTPMQ